MKILKAEIFIYNYKPLKVKLRSILKMEDKDRLIKRECGKKLEKLN